jgi:hypothetical protein
MTVSTTTSEARFEGNGSATVFPLGFEIEDDSHLSVNLIQLNGVPSPLTLNVNYTVSGVNNESGATLTLGRVMEVGEALVVRRNTPRTQPNSLLPNAGFSPTAVENALDRVVLIVQEIAGLNDRALKVPIGEAPLDLPQLSARIGRLLGFDTSGNPIAVESIDSALVSELWLQILLKNTVSAARQDLFSFGYLRNATTIDFNALGAGAGGVTSGFYATDASAIGLPAGEDGIGGHILALNYNPNVNLGIQVYFSPSGFIWRRGRTGGTFSSWVRLHTTTDNLAPRPITSAGIGQWVNLFGATNAALVLPAGGTWAWHYTQRVTSTAVHNGTSSGISAGGSTIATAAANLDHWGFAWRLT